MQALLAGDAIAAPPSERELIETHISSLILAGDIVYKLHKPLKLDFLDFSTPELRRADCLEELRLNRRTAPQLYLDVLPLVGTADAPRIGAAGDAAGPSAGCCGCAASSSPRCSTRWRAKAG